MEREQQPWSFMASFNWPPRSYSCSFCKREFRSAQALGGHMNVHRRDRARLRHTGSPSPPPPPLPPANASSKAPAALAKPPPPVPNLNYPPPLLPYHRDGGKKRSWTDDVSTGLGVGLLQSSCTTAASSTDPAVGPHPEDDDDDDDLDLELRLGVS